MKVSVAALACVYESCRVLSVCLSVLAALACTKPNEMMVLVKWPLSNSKPQNEGGE